ncbi:HGxxPAAW family protein [Kitasatospora sp. NPDC004745]|uniref:HGxxPAAW family protein n=1 Tax=unclassified Kitasatospora TaxID=2633591 RepID=UPI0033D12B66
MAAAAHGHTPAAWTGVTISFIGSGIAGVAMILPSVLLVWAGLAVVLAGGVVGKAMSMAGMGKQPSTNVYASREEQAEAHAARAALAAATA